MHGGILAESDKEKQSVRAHSAAEVLVYWAGAYGIEQSPFVARGTLQRDASTSNCFVTDEDPEG